MDKNNVDAFKTWLKAQDGVEVLPTSNNDWELVRFKTANGISIVYSSRRGVSHTGESAEAYKKFKDKNVWQVLRTDQKKRMAVQKKIERRDGGECFYCGIDTVVGENRTMEHLLSVSKGGNNNEANLVIACQTCNLAAADIPIIDKVRFREKKRGQNGEK